MQWEFKLNVVDSWCLEYQGVPIQLTNRKARALVSFLAINRSARQTRRSMCHLLWPDVDDERARASLRQCLVAVRNAEPALTRDILTITSEHIALNKDLIETDIEEILRKLEAGGITDDLLDTIKTVPLLLGGIEDVSEPFSEWVGGIRETLASRAIAALKRHYSAATKPAGERVASAQTALTLDPFDEDAVRALMELHNQQDNPTAALNVYGTFYRFLESEMDAVPSTATQDLAVSIKLGSTVRETEPSPPVLPQTLAKRRPPAVTVAVLPFEIIDAKETDHYLALGLLDHMTCHLASFQAPSVISSNTTRQYLGCLLRTAEIGRDLNAQYVLSGTLRLNGGDAFLTAQLSAAEDERVVWATTQGCSRTDLEKLNLPIAEDIARAIVPSVDAAELRNSRSMASDDLEPYHLVLQAKELIFRLVDDDFLAAGGLLRRAVQLGPDFSPAHAMLAEWLSINLWEGLSQDPAKDRIQLDQHLRRASALAPHNGRVLALWAHNIMMFERDYDTAQRMLKQAVSLQPNDAETLAWSVPTLANTRHDEVAVQNGLKALALSPYDPFIFRNEHFCSLALYVSGAYDKSADYGLSCFERAPTYRSNIRTTIVSLTAAGRTAEARSLAEHHNKITPDFSVTDFKRVSGLRDVSDREVYASRLLSAGLPA